MPATATKTTQNGHDADAEETLSAAERARLILNAVADAGEISQAELVTLLADRMDEREIAKSLTRNDRQGLVVWQAASESWQITSRGRDAMKDIAAKAVAPLIMPYSSFTIVEATYFLITPSLGCLTPPGGKEKAVWYRLPDKAILFPGACLRAAFMKGMQRIDATRLDLTTGMLRAVPMASWDHVNFKTIRLPGDTVLETCVRRPVNTKGEAIGELLHEGLPIGTTFTVEASFPLSHFLLPIIKTLCQMAGDVGFSPAGSGRGGRWGVAELVRLVIGGEEQAI